MSDQKKPQNDRLYYLFALKIVGDFGATIAVPVVVLALVGRYLDNHWHTSRPYITIAGFALAAMFTAKIIYRKAKIYGETYQKLK